MSDDLAGRALTTMLGSFGGFLLGLIAMIIKDSREQAKKLSALKIQMTFVTTNLAHVLHEDPRSIAWIKIDGLIGSLELFSESTEFQNDMLKLVNIYSQWDRGFFFGSGIRAPEINLVKDELAGIGSRISRLPPL